MKTMGLQNSCERMAELMVDEMVRIDATCHPHYLMLDERGKEWLSCWLENAYMSGYRKAMRKQREEPKPKRRKKGA